MFTDGRSGQLVAKFWPRAMMGACDFQRLEQEIVSLSIIEANIITSNTMIA
jgi:hypothetical protein